MTDIIVIGFDRAQETYLTVKSLVESNENVRIILIHNGSTKKPYLSDLKGDIVEVHLRQNLGQAKAVNIGLDIAKSEYVAVCHNDIVIRDKNWVDKAVSFLKNNKDAGLIDPLGFIWENGIKIRISSLIRKPGTQLKEDFVEVERTDNIANVFKNDGIRVDERYKYCGTEIATDLKGRGLKLFVMKFDDAKHISTSSRDLESYKKLTTFEEELKHQNEVTTRKFEELGLLLPGRK